MADRHPAYRLMVESWVLEIDVVENHEISTEKARYLHSEVIGSLRHLMIETRPDLAFPLARLCQIYDSPGLASWNIVEGVLQYINGTRG